MSWWRFPALSWVPDAPFRHVMAAISGNEVVRTSLVKITTAPGHREPETTKPAWSSNASSVSNFLSARFDNLGLLGLAAPTPEAPPRHGALKSGAGATHSQQGWS
jgi:hypothetical protein